MYKAQVPLSFHTSTLMAAYTMSVPKVLGAAKNSAAKLPSQSIEACTPQKHKLQKAPTPKARNFLNSSFTKTVAEESSAAKKSLMRAHDLSLSGKKIPKVMVAKLGMSKVEHCRSGCFSMSVNCEKGISAGSGSLVHHAGSACGSLVESKLEYLATAAILSAMEKLLNFKDFLAYLKVSKRLYKRSRVRRKLTLVLMEGGMTGKLRRKYWFAQCGVTELARKDPHNLSYYLAKECPFDSDIAKDLDRTFPRHHQFYAKPENRQRLNNVLRAFAVKNPDIGYVQGLNFVAGHLLLQFSDEVNSHNEE